MEHEIDHTVSRLVIMVVMTILVQSRTRRHHLGEGELAQDQNRERGFHHLWDIDAHAVDRGVRRIREGKSPGNPSGIENQKPGLVKD